MYVGVQNRDVWMWPGITGDAEYLEYCEDLWRGWPNQKGSWNMLTASLFTFRILTWHRRPGIMTRTYWSHLLGPKSSFLLMPNPWAHGSWLSWPGRRAWAAGSGNRGAGQGMVGKCSTILCQDCFAQTTATPEEVTRLVIEGINEVSNEVAYWELRSMSSFWTCRWQGPME